MVEPIHLAGAQLERQRHVCALFPDRDEEDSVLIPFFVEGLQRGEKIFYGVDPKRRSEHLERLRRGGIDVRHAEQTGQLEVRGWDEVYAPDGRFNVERILRFIDGILSAARASGFRGTRLVAHMEWAVEAIQGADEFLEYESRITRMLMGRPDPVVCIYDANKFAGHLVLDVVRTHPMNIVDGVLQEHPFFTMADELLREFREREKSPKRIPSSVQRSDEQGEVECRKHLRAAVRDLTALLLVPATWRTFDSTAVIENLLDVMTALAPLQFAFAVMIDERHGGRKYFYKSRLHEPPVSPEELGRSVDCLGGQLMPVSMANPFGEGSLQVVTWPLGVNGRWGCFAAASANDFLPTDVVLLRAASTQAVLALDAAKNRAIEAEKLKIEAEKLRAAAELAQLRAHLEPHFLLNTLNAIGGLVSANPSEARQLLVSLGDLLRDLLRDHGDTQTLEAQIDWLHRYAQILQVRHAGRLVFRWEIAQEAKPVLLPRLLLQPLVENAVQHGALRRDRGGEVTVRARILGSGKDATLVCSVEDNGPGLPQGQARAEARGLASVESSLAFKYGNKATLRLESSSSGTKAIVKLPAGVTGWTREA